MASVLTTGFLVGADAAYFLPLLFFAALALRLAAAATVFLIEATEDLRDLAELLEAADLALFTALVDTAFLLDALTFLAEVLFTALIVISEAVLLSLSVF